MLATPDTIRLSQHHRWPFSQPAMTLPQRPLQPDMIFGLLRSWKKTKKTISVKINRGWCLLSSSAAIQETAAIFLNGRVLELHLVSPCWSSCVIWYLRQWGNEQSAPFESFFSPDGFVTRACLPSKSNDFLLSYHSLDLKANKIQCWCFSLWPQNSFKACYLKDVIPRMSLSGALTVAPAITVQL